MRSSDPVAMRIALCSRVSAVSYGSGLGTGTVSQAPAARTEQILKSGSCENVKL